jgi:enoyl-CoA hydratase/carnithine racemase
MSYRQIRYEKGDDHVATITIDRPDRLNTFTDVMADEFVDVWRQVREDDGVHAVVLRGAPESRAFSTGIDVSEGMEMLRHANVWRQGDPGEKLGPKHNDVWKPVVCAMHGLVAAGAFYWVNEADIAICSEDTQFFDPHVTFGMVAALEPIGLSRRILRCASASSARSPAVRICMHAPMRLPRSSPASRARRRRAPCARCGNRSISG